MGQQETVVRRAAQKWAVLVGVDDYSELRKLRFAGNDQRALAEQLIASGFPKDNVYVLHDKADDKKYLPFRSNIEKQIQLVINMADKEDLLIVGFSGHGVQLEDKSYLCPEDAEISKLAETIIPLDSIYDRLSQCKASLKLLLVDACRSDVVPEGRRGVALARALGDFGGARERPPEGILLLASCAPGQFSMEDPKFEHGVFMHFIIEGLQGKAGTGGSVSLAGLYDFASLNTKRYVAREFNESQTPALKGEISGPFEICSAAPAKPIINSIGMKLVLIPAGQFTMGAPDRDAFGPDKPQHPVRITKPFYLGACHVTVGQFRNFVEHANYQTDAERANQAEAEQWKEKTWRNVSPSQPDEHPVVYVSWNDAVAFCQWLSRKEGNSYRLPTEAEWEYACRAGSATRYCFGDDESGLAEYAWYRENSDDGTHPVGQKRPNAWGLYDMHGNVRGWCQDYYNDGYYANSPTDDPTGPAVGVESNLFNRYNQRSPPDRVIRGGAWLSYANVCSSAYRAHDSPLRRDYHLGFRVARVPADK
jgi:formylglycine-generating enzyme required for sulfatase activity